MDALIAISKVQALYHSGLAIKIRFAVPGHTTRMWASCKAAMHLSASATDSPKCPVKANTVGGTPFSIQNLYRKARRPSNVGEDATGRIGTSQGSLPIEVSVASLADAFAIVGMNHEKQQRTCCKASSLCKVLKYCVTHDCR